MSFSALYTGATGMTALGTGLQVISNNLANQDTVAFKEGLALYQDLVSSLETTPSNLQTNFSQLGHGVTLMDVSTRFYENGTFRASNTATDLAIEGSGFFQVTSGDRVHYTRAGNFRLNNEGALVDPSGFVLSARPIADGARGDIEPAVITPEKQEMPAKATSQVKMGLNIGSSADSVVNTENPFFSLAQSWNGARQDEPVGTTGFTNTFQVYDSTGKSHTLTMYADAVTTNAQGLKVYEYVIGMNPAEDARDVSARDAGMLMAGNLIFSASGKLMSMSAFTPTEGSDFSDLSTWTPAQGGENGPAMNLSFLTAPAADGEAPGRVDQTLSLDLGLGGAWTRSSGTPADIGADPSKLAGYTDARQGRLTAASGPYATTAFNGASSQNYASQDGYASGSLVRVEFTSDGVMRGTYSNNQTVDLYQVPLFNFRGVQGLNAEGNNHFTPTTESGEALEGVPGTDNFGSIKGSSLEVSNVDMARQMSQMIITQRDFQFNSKTVQTADSMLQKAIELKR